MVECRTQHPLSICGSWFVSFIRSLQHDQEPFQQHAAASREEEPAEKRELDGVARKKARELRALEIIKQEGFLGEGAVAPAGTFAPPAAAPAAACAHGQNVFRFSMIGWSRWTEE